MRARLRQNHRFGTGKPPNTVPKTVTIKSVNSLERLQHAINRLPNHRALLGEAALETTLAVLEMERERLAAPNPTGELSRTATALVADMVNFTQLSATLDAEDITNLVNQLWWQLDGVIAAHEGTVAKHVGDAVIALWGLADQPPAQAAWHAVQAALALQTATASFNPDRLPAAILQPVQIRVGISTGPVALSAFGVREAFDALGEAVNTAAHLQHAAPPGGIFVAVDTYRHIRPMLAAQESPPFALRPEALPAAGDTALHAYQVIRPTAP